MVYTAPGAAAVTLRIRWGREGREEGSGRGGGGGRSGGPDFPTGGAGHGQRPIRSSGRVGGCVKDRRPDAGAAAPSGRPEDARTAERTPECRQRAARARSVGTVRADGLRLLESGLGMALPRAEEGDTASISIRGHIFDMSVSASRALG
ncbi:uncharacterized protein RHO17_021699 [Thomomys bottae]